MICLGFFVVFSVELMDANRTSELCKKSLNCL